VLKGILAFLLILVLLTFAFVIGSQNETLITVNYLIAQANLRVSTLIAITLSIGVGIGVLLMLVSWLRLRVQLLTAQSKLQSLENNR
jgi:putative membrane protein|tara:strand:+ start:165 stop:425 length:261 start_codon:yes stop_codon:yes gene_type:complete